MPYFALDIARFHPSLGPQSMMPGSPVHNLDTTPRRFTGKSLIYYSPIDVTLSEFDRNDFERSSG